MKLMKHRRAILFSTHRLLFDPMVLGSIIGYPDQSQTFGSVIQSYDSEQAEKAEKEFVGSLPGSKVAARISYCVV
ncbi:hypothetical protein AC578_3672 [Pseudocercospora eumusae]|uniref:Uncharacterized protein n=1 Tax=Pseudocercospora eumusae TaxID=321146 RepID=A0A139GXF6_9PEZI|nr:hypothetical protein AC578_3672 [Pseudocercospora eumusae]